MKSVNDYGFILKGFKEEKYKDKISKYEKRITDILEEMTRLLALDKRLYAGKDYSSIDLINLSNYLNMMTNHLQDCRDALVNIWNTVDGHIFDLVEEYEQENRDAQD